MIPLKPATPVSASRELGPVDVQRISVANSDLVDRAEEHRGRVVGVGQIGGCGRLAVPLSIVGDECLAALAGCLVRVVAEAQLRTWKVDALRLGDGQKLRDQQGCAANQRDVLKSSDLADLLDDVGAFFLEEGKKEAIRTARRNPGEDGDHIRITPADRGGGDRTAKLLERGGEGAGEASSVGVAVVDGGHPA